MAWARLATSESKMMQRKLRQKVFMEIMAACGQERKTHPHVRLLYCRFFAHQHRLYLAWV
jgi:hypothetical protein